MRAPPFSKATLSTLVRTQRAAPRTTSDTYATLLRRCIAERSLDKARRVHLHMVMSGFPHLSLGNKLVDAYLKCGAVDDARKVFDAMPKPHIVSWNALVSSYVRCRRTHEAVRLYKRMLSEGVVADEFTFSSVLRAFSDLGLVAQGATAHGQLVVSCVDARNAFVGSALVDMYAKFGRLREARCVYDRVHGKDVILATALVVGYTQNGEYSEAIELFGRIVKDGIHPNDFTFASVLIACGNTGDLRKGLAIHGIMAKIGNKLCCSSQTSLLTMYSRCGLIDDAMKVFVDILDPSTVTWTAIIGCMVCNHREELALSMLRGMIHSSVRPNAFTLSTALRACSALALFEQGKLIHAFAIKLGLDSNRFVCVALIDTYGKCGRIEMAKIIFDDLPGLDVVTMNCMINAYAQNGHGVEALRLFETMKVPSLEPNGATFTGVLSGCTNAGLVEEGRRVFSFIVDKYKCGPSSDHYACMVDILGRAGKLEEAERLVCEHRNPDKVLWRSLLSACRLHGKLEMAKRVARNILKLDPADDGTYILLSNIYASLGQWDEVISMKSAMRKMKLKKEPAMSWIEVDRKYHTFMAGDRDHLQAEEIYKELEELIRRTKELGYVPNARYVLQEMDEVEKERSLYYHSEKLAVTFGVMSSSNDKGDKPITIFKNLRVCGDCHSWIKLVSQVVGKEIIARDAKRFHHFKNGMCSCNDYW
ncbi:pentatricopeptide repeat-containing protein [Canna indica]|uniref:Pentatricopeptide repeat-containing protein n=1 Tax=Canna indica TaxID=4628 RepID=A0AAQ3QHP2_9LILI|nr:pentatricopeptide repeat-containing protein [Canna indica]